MTKTKNIIGLYVALALVLFVAVGVVHADALNRQLQVGMSGSDVGVLQTYLATDPSLYPQGLVTNYFGFLTKAAVSNFQSRNGIDPVGRVGPVTLPVLNRAIAGGGVTTSGAAPMIYGVTTSATVNSATIKWGTNEASRGLVYYSSSPLTTYEHPNSVDVSGNTAMTDVNYRTSQSIAIQSLQANTTYYYMIYTTDQDGNVSVTWPATFRTTN